MKQVRIGETELLNRLEVRSLERVLYVPGRHCELIRKEAGYRACEETSCC